MRAHMYNRHRSFLPAALALTLLVVRAFAGTPDLPPSPAPSSADDLTLENLFTKGWDEPFVMRQSLADGAPDLPLFHSPANFMVRVSRTDFSFQDDLDKCSTKSIAYLDEYLDFAVNQRFMLSVFTDYTWLNNATQPREDGVGGGVSGRFQLLDTPTSSDSINLRVDVPSRDIGIHTTALSAAFMGWKDLSPAGARGVGVYYALQNNVYAGYNAPGATRDALTYEIALARTWTSYSAPLGDLTSFVEFSGATNLDGDACTRTQLAITPALQFFLGGRNLFMLGVDFPVTHPAVDRQVYRITYVYCF